VTTCLDTVIDFPDHTHSLGIQTKYGGAFAKVWPYACNRIRHMFGSWIAFLHQLHHQTSLPIQIRSLCILLLLVALPLHASRKTNHTKRDTSFFPSSINPFLSFCVFISTIQFLHITSIIHLLAHKLISLNNYTLTDTTLKY
jgi:hypothetical protein